jgi:hypothetical protein
MRPIVDSSLLVDGHPRAVSTIRSSTAKEIIPSQLLAFVRNRLMNRAGIILSFLALFSQDGTQGICLTAIVGGGAYARADEG